MTMSSSSSSTSGPVHLGNFYSSFDTQSVLQQLTAAMQIPITQLTSRQQMLSRQNAAISTLVGKFSSLLNDVDSLTSSTSASTRTATVSGTGVTATASPSSTLGSFTVGVTGLATGTSATGTALTAVLDSVSTLNNSNFGTKVSAGTFTMKAATGSTVTITVDPATQSLDDVITAINAQTGTSGITASIQNDANGRANVLQLDSTQGSIQLGLGSDTSNFLTATNLLASPGTTTRASTLSIARLSLSQAMSGASFFGGAPVAGAHTLTINGVAISYDAGIDSLNDLITRINSSTAGVTASYNSVTDSLSLTQNKLGSVAMSLADDGQFLSTTGLASATQSLGSNASYSVNGGATQYSGSNTVTLPDGTTLTLTALTGGSPATVAVAQDTAAPAQLMTTFVSDYNTLMQSLRDLTKSAAGAAGLFAGDTGMMSLLASLRSVIGGTGQNVVSRYQTLNGIGLSFGAIGSAPGTANTLQLDAAAFEAALKADPLSVQNALSTLSFAASIAGGSTGSITGLTGSYKGTKTGQFVITDDGSGHLTSTFTPNDGSAAVTQSVTVSPNSTETSLVLGMTLNIGALQAGTTTINVTQNGVSVMQQLKHAGVRFAIDDFGTGYSSLAQLQRLPVDELKIDRAFICGLDADAGKQVIVHSTTELAHSLGLDVVAEGVETPEVWSSLLRAGCDLAQGYLISRPMPATAAMDWLARQQQTLDRAFAEASSQGTVVDLKSRNS